MHSGERAVRSHTWFTPSLSFAVLVTGICVCACNLTPLEATPADEAIRTLRLVPFPKEVKPWEGRYKLPPSLRLDMPDGPMAREAAEQLSDDLTRAGGIKMTRRFMPSGKSWFAWLAEPRVLDGPLDLLTPTVPDKPEAYVIAVNKAVICVSARNERGFLHGIQSLRQLIRANTRDGSIPCVKIRDWPSLRYRGYSDDITRGPSPKLEFLKDELRQTSYLKMNFWTYYMEYQYAFKKHPIIGPKDGSLTPNELKAMVEYGKKCGVEIIGNQQSFGHFEDILRHKKYRPLGETHYVLNPTNEKVYDLLDDLYSEVAPLLESKLFNVCCDETWGLGTGPSKPVAEKIGVGAVYANHLRRLHDLLRDKYGKRMMMWGDIIIKHPEHLPKIPKDTIVLSWGYHAAESFDKVITPFSKSGYEFFVCPGVSCWSRILPDFGVAVTNIHNYVRDGAEHGTLGMLNTTWDDDGENFFTWNWHGLAWGAECAWNASTTPYEEFNRRIGGVLFGEPGDHFGRAIDLLAKAHRLPGYEGMNDKRFWELEFGDKAKPMDKAAARKQADSLLKITQPAIEHLRACRDAARINADWLDYFLFGAERIQLMATRVMDYLAAKDALERARQNEGDSNVLLRTARTKLAKIAEDHRKLKDRYVKLWNRENKPYALDWVTKRFDALIAKCEKAVDDLALAHVPFGTAGASARIEFHRRYERWKKHVASVPPSLSSTFPVKQYYENEPYRNLIALGPAYLPYFTDMAEEDGSSWAPIYDITKWRPEYRRKGDGPTKWVWELDGFPESSSRRGPPGPADLWRFWWEQGRHKVPTVFEGLYRKWKQKESEGNRAEAGKLLKRITNLGLFALPCVVEKVLAGDEGLRPVLVELTDGAISKDTDAATTKAWWQTKKQGWAILWSPAKRYPHPSEEGNGS